MKVFKNTLAKNLNNNFTNDVNIIENKLESSVLEILYTSDVFLLNELYNELCTDLAFEIIRNRLNEI